METMVERYKQLRASQVSLNSKLLRFLPQGVKGKNMILAAAKEIGYHVTGHAISFSSEAAVDRLYDFLIYEPDSGGKSYARRFLETNPDITALEEAVLRAAVVAETSLFEVVVTNRPRKSFVLVDLLQERRPISVFDINMSQTVIVGTLTFARILTVDKINFTSGTGVAFAPDDKEFLLGQCQKLAKIKNPALQSRKRYALFMNLEKFSNVKTRYEDPPD